MEKIIRDHGIYRHACPNCLGPEGDSRLVLGLPCPKCLPKVEPARLDPKTIARMLKEVGSLKHYKEIVKLEEELEKVEKIFGKALGSRFWSAQRTWAKRVLKGKSFAIIAPTGVGKTVFGITMALYFAEKGKKSYIILPTTPLVQLVEKRAEEMARAAGVEARILAIHSKLKRKELSERLAKLDAGDFDVLITTSRFLQSRLPELRRHHFAFIFVDDVDAVLKSSKSIDAILLLMGFDEKDIQLGMELLKIKRALVREENEELQKKVEKLEAKLERKRKKIESVLVVSSATGRVRGQRARLFRELLGFEAGSRSELIRNIVDTYKEPRTSVDDAVIEVVSKLGTGGLVFVPVDKGIEYADSLAEKLREHGIKAAPFHAKSPTTLQDFINGDVDVLVGVATYYGVMVRGIDLPERVRYAVFAGVPRLKFNTRLEKPTPADVLRGLGLVRDLLEQGEREKVDALMVRLRRYMTRLSPAALRMLAEKMQKGEPPETPVEKLFYEALDLARRLLSDPKVREKLRERGDVALVEEKGTLYVLIPDIMTYIQASGRTSRMYAGGITKGLSVVVVDDERLIRGLIRRSKWVIEDIEWKNFDEVNLEELIKEIDEDRKRVKEVLEGKIKERVKDLVKTALLVVESPNKARTIANFFGRPSVRIVGKGLRVYEVSTGDYMLTIAASGGHVYDLVTDEGFHGVLVTDEGFLPVYTALRRCLKCGHQFSDDRDECPRCGSKSIRSSLDVIEALRDISTEVDIVMIGTDPDTEGEKIGWDIASLLAPYTGNVVRVEFHEVTRKAILNAIRNPRDFNVRLVEAQIVRRVEDRWIGFTLSPKLWYEFWPWYCREVLKREKFTINRNLSAGRVQTPVLGWIVKNYEEHRASIRKIYRVRVAGLEVEFLADEFQGMKPEEVKKLKAEIEVLKDEIVEVKPLPPFTTDMMLSEASAKLGLGAPQVMQLAQELFELGFITYHRTDSTRVSDAGIAVAREYLQEKLGDTWKDYFAPRTWGAGGAHECIRPTRPLDPERLRQLIAEGIMQPVRRLTRRHFALYDLIFRRFIASQMKPAKLEKQTILLRIGSAEKTLEVYVKVVEPGFTLFYQPFQLYQSFKKGEYPVEDVISYKKALTPLLSQGDVVRLMKERGIGRPSTYAKIVQTILQRKYVKETPKHKKLVPTKLGMHVYAWLTERYGSLVSEQRTRELEAQMDLIERGEKEYQEVLRELYEEIKSIE